MILDEYYQQQERKNYISLNKNILNAREPFKYHEKTIDDDDLSHITNNFQFSVFPSENFLPVSITAKAIDQNESSKMQTLKSNGADFHSIHRVERNIDDDDVDLMEPKNDIEVETKQLSNNIRLESAHAISGSHNYYDQIKPTKTVFHANLGDDDIIKSDIIHFTNPGEAQRASSRGRSLLLTKPVSAKLELNATDLVSKSASGRSNPDDRQSNSDIQDIINGFVKLLNGNVQVQVNTNGPPGKPSFPSRTRINNRGPPRITDVPPIIFDQPVQIPPNMPQNLPPTSTPTQPTQQGNRGPPPYPFDIPHSLPTQTVLRPFVSGVPLPEQVVPLNSTNVLDKTLITSSNGNETNQKEPVKSSSDILFNFNSSSTIEKINRTQIKVTPNTSLLTPVFVAPIQSFENSITDKKNVSSKPEIIFENENKIEIKWSSKVNTTQASLKNNNSSKSATVVLDIEPSVTVPPLKTSTPPMVKPETLEGLPATGVGSAVVVLEPSTQEVPTSSEVHKASTSILGSTSSIGITSTVMRKRPAPSHSPSYSSKCLLFINYTYKIYMHELTYVYTVS